MSLTYAENIAFSSVETLHFTFDCAVKYKDADGDFVECGVAAGAQIIAMALGAPNKTIWAFDSFEGIPLPSNKDDQMPGIKKLSMSEIVKLPNPGEQELKSSGATKFSIDRFYGNLQKAGIDATKIIAVKGWFENTLPKNNVEKISILRLDGDLYYSTFICLTHLFEKVIYGGTVIIDDWELAGCRRACKDYFRSISYEPNYQTVSNIRYFIK